MAWYEYKVSYVEGQSEILNAFLIQLGVDAIHEEAGFFLVYKKDPTDPASFGSEIKALMGCKELDAYIECEEKNWNAVWESNYDPIVIENICSIRAEFHPKREDLPYEIVIRPQMAFGTGHHETTFMMIQTMDALDLKGKQVLDYGCGTGILAVFAKMKGADFIVGNDIEKPAIDNAHLHLEINDLDVSKFDYRLGDITILPEKKYDVILANINRRVLLESVELLSTMLFQDGSLLLSGILKADETLVQNTYRPFFELITTTYKGEWICQKWQPKN